MISRNETWPIVLFFVVAFACRIIFEWGFFASVGAGLAIRFLVYVLVWRKRERERCVAQPAAPRGRCCTLRLGTVSRRG